MLYDDKQFRGQSRKTLLFRYIDVMSAMGRTRGTRAPMHHAFMLRREGRKPTRNLLILRVVCVLAVESAHKKSSTLILSHMDREMLSGL